MPNFPCLHQALEPLLQVGAAQVHQLHRRPPLTQAASYRTAAAAVCFLSLSSLESWMGSQRIAAAATRRRAAPFGGDGCLPMPQ
jgi:hypothetical protein